MQALAAGAIGTNATGVGRRQFNATTGRAAAKGSNLAAAQPFLALVAHVAALADDQQDAHHY